MKIVEFTRTPASVAVGMTALLTLTACSGGSADYDFTEPLAEGVPSIEFTIPRELAELNEEYVENRVFDSVTISSVDAEDPAGCAVEYRFDYANGALERLLEHTENSKWVIEYGETVEERMSYYLTDWNPDRADLGAIEFDEGFGSAVVPVGCAASPSEDDFTTTVNVCFPWIGKGESDAEVAVRDFACADISVMRSGDLYVRESEVREWQVDSDGNWIKQ